MQGIPIPCSSTSALYCGLKLPALPDHIFAGYLFLCLIAAHEKTSLGFYQVLLNSGQIESLHIFCQDELYDYPMFPNTPKQDHHVPGIDICELHVLRGHKVPQLKVNNVASVLEFSKPYIGWHTQQAVAATTTSSGTRFPYYMCHSSQRTPT